MCIELHTVQSAGVFSQTCTTTLGSDINNDEHLRVAGRLADLHGAVRDRLDLGAAHMPAAVKALAPPARRLVRYRG